VSGSLMGDRGGISRRLNDGTVAATGGGGKRAAHGGGAPFIDDEDESGVATRLWAARW
jgi:hypothetical protein